MPARIKPQDRFQSLDTDEQIRRAIPVARELLIGGFDSGRHENKTIIDAVAEVLTPKLRAALKQEWKDLEDVEASDLWDRLEAAQALGIAIGLLTQADLFAKGGAR